MRDICLGFSVGHTRGAALTIDGELKVAIANERITRIKDDRSVNIPIEAVNYCLEAEGLTYNDVTLWVYNTTEDINDIPEQYTNLFGQPIERLQFLPHHQAHAYSTFMASDFEEATVIVADAMGSVYNDETPIKEWYQLDDSDLNPGEQYAEGFSIYHFSKGELRPTAVYKKWIRYPFKPEYEGSIGYLYGMGAKQLVYNEKTNNWQSGKLMGLASYAEKEFVDSYPTYSIHTEDDLQVPAFPILEHETNWKSDFQSKANVAGLYQREQELNSIHLAKMAKNMTGSDNLCVSGGSFLNCNTNEALIKLNIFDNNYFVPAADDSGIALGCAFYGMALLNDNTIPERNKWMTPYLGKTYTGGEISLAAMQFNGLNVRALRKGEAPQIAAQMLSENKVIGWMQNGSEIGPRALGNRSILANPSKKWMLEYINSEIKKREWYRPFAPSVLFERQNEVFEMDNYSPYMLVTTQVAEGWAEKIPAVTHFDNTSRHQSVTPTSNPEYYALISEFEKLTGIPVVLNTSFNGPEEPIVETPMNAINTMLNHDLYAVFINNFVITRTNE